QRASSVALHFGRRRRPRPVPRGPDSTHSEDVLGHKVGPRNRDTKLGRLPAVWHPRLVTVRRQVTRRLTRSGAIPFNGTSQLRPYIPCGVGTVAVLGLLSLQLLIFRLMTRGLTRSRRFSSTSSATAATEFRDHFRGHCRLAGHFPGKIPGDNPA